MLPVRTILHPTDFSERSNYAFRCACSLAQDYGARLVVLHVYTPLVVGSPEGVFVQSDIEDKEALREQFQQLQPRDPSVQMECRIVEGDSATEILRAAEETKCDVIVLGTHGRTGLSRLLLGSVAEQVVRRALCPVVTIKTPLREAVSAEEPASATAAGQPAAPPG
jgi:nucleotide-binding universal stress UspA family protein